MKSPPHKPGPPTGLREGLARRRGHRKREGRRVANEDRARPGPSGKDMLSSPGGPPPEARRASAAAGSELSEEPETATDVGRRRDAPRPVLRASKGLRWRGAVDTLPERVRVGRGALGR